MSRWLYWAIMASFGVIIASIVLICYLKFWPVTPVIFHQNPIPILGHAFRPGDVVPAHFDFTRYTYGAPVTYRKLVNEVIVYLPPVMGRVKEPGNYDFISYSTVIPKNMPPGEAYIEYCHSYPINFMRDEEVIVRSQKFKVVK